MHGIHTPPLITERMAAPADARYVWTVNNDPTVRAQALHTADIPWESHLEWYQRQLLRSDGALLIGLELDRPIGVARFDVSNGEAVITIAVAPEHRGRGVGQGLVRSVTAQALARAEVRIAVAYTRPGNLASQRAFLNNQYRDVGSTVLSGVTMLRFEKSREGI
jgi:UDP-2,4-diacetamido-2,4,6-trideoxy-beta-L-altropyranose hydrolase